MTDPRSRVLACVDDAADEIVDFAARLIRLPTVNPPGAHYAECADLIGSQLTELGFAVEFDEPEPLAEHAGHPRRNVVGVLGGARRPVIHLNGHFDVVPPGAGWTVEPFGGLVRDGRLYGRGSADMKAGIAAAVFAAGAIRRADLRLAATVEVSGTVDEESGGLAGVGHLARAGRIAADRTDYFIIPEPFGPTRICVGHRGVYWFKVAALGRTAHGSMPFLGANAVDHLSAFLEAVRRDLAPVLATRRTAMPVVPDAARAASINVNAIVGGQAGESSQTPCVADRCEAIFDRRFLEEEDAAQVRQEIVDLLARTEAADRARRYELSDLMTVRPVRTPPDSPLIGALERSIDHVLGQPAHQVASPGTYDHKHVAGIAGVPHCVAYGPGILEQAHQPDEWCAVEDLIAATKVLALTVLELGGSAR